MNNSSIYYFLISRLFGCANFYQFIKKTMKLTAYFIVLVTSFLSSANTQNSSTAQTQIRQLNQLAEYVGVDYVSAVKNGDVINADEFKEMVEFTQLIVERINLLADIPEIKKFTVVQAKAQALKQAVVNKNSASLVRQLSSDLRRLLLAQMPIMTMPTQLLTKQQTETLFQENCAQCHGESGLGNGVLAANLDPKPTNFTEQDRAANRSLLGLFDAISNGLDDTAMPAFTGLKERQRWSLAFYVGSLAFKQAPANSSSTIPTSLIKNIDMQQWVNQSPQQIAETYASIGLTQQQITQLRANPELLFSQQPSPLVVTKTKLKQALTAYKNKQYKQANSLAVSAYLDGFELVENNLDAHDVNLRKNIEGTLIQLRELLLKADKETLLTQLSSQLFAQLNQAEQLLVAANLSDEALFSASLVILLREGLEALLVVIALITVLIKTQAYNALKYVHLGWLVALVAGGATWAAAQSLISISGASREVMEGFGALLAALMLLYVGIWMHSKTKAEHWQAYIQQHINSHLASGKLWGLAALSFIAVYREILETVLFYQSLLTQAQHSQYVSVLSGFVLGCVLLALVAWLMLKYSIKLPMSRFFSSTTYLLLILSFVLMGKAVSALQEAAMLTITPLPITLEFSWLGIGSTWQGVMAQSAVIIFFVIYLKLSKQKPQIMSEQIS